MSYWYPKKSRADELTARIRRLETAFEQGLDAGADRLLHLSGRLAEALGRTDFPQRQIAHWVWTAAQYRLAAGVDALVAACAAAALVFLEEALSKESLDNDDRRELNWVLETTVGKLGALVGPAHLKGCLSVDELRAIDERLEHFEDDGPFDSEAIAAAVRSQLDTLRYFGNLGDLSGLVGKVEVLIAAAARPGEQNAPARCALRYLAERSDVVDDDAGMLGLIDDVYVLEWAYAAVENQTQCLPILNAMSLRWPFVTSLGLSADGAALDRFGQYAVCAALTTLSGPQPGALALREVGPYALLSAIAAAVEAAADQGQAFADEMTLWAPGEAMTISDGTTVFHVRYGGRIEGTARLRWRLHVADAGSITVGEEILPYLARARRDWKRLSNGTQIQTWLKDRHVDALVGLTGHGRRRPERHRAILLVTGRSKADRFLADLRPQGVAPAALLGARWVDARGGIHDLPGSATDRPLLYLCGDVGSACDLVVDPPDHVEGWRVIVDGAGLGRALHAALSTSGRLTGASMCVFADLHDRENLEGLVDQGLGDVWYVEDQDVEVPPMTHPGRSDETDPLGRFLARRSAHWTASYAVHESEDPFLEAVAACLKDGDHRKRHDPGLDALDLAVAGFLRRAGSHPLPGDEERETLAGMAVGVAAQASALAIYEPHAVRVRDLFLAYSPDGASKRRDAFLGLGASIPGDEAVAVVCRSSATAESCRRTAASIETLGGFEWTTVETLRTGAPFDRVVVPGWLGRHAMREISNIGFGARTDILLLPFERQWYEKTMAAGRRWERTLERRTTVLLKRFVDDGLTADEPRWKEQTSRRFAASTPADDTPIDDRPETVRAEIRAVENIRSSLPVGVSHETAKAQLVLFTEPGAFALLPPAGRVIILPENDEQDEEGRGERRLFRPVADLAAGMLTALPHEADRDLIDVWADRLLGDGGQTREAADRWKTALKHHFAQTNESYAAFARRLGERGERRDAFTVRSWANDTRSVAPRNFKRVLPLLAEMIDDAKLASTMSETLEAIDNVYDARGAAADAIVSEIFSGKLDLSSNKLTVDVEGRRVGYHLARVERIAGMQDVPVELIGRRLHLADIPRDTTSTL